MTFTTVSQPRHLKEILELQKQNLRHGRTEEDIGREGFVTCEHSLELLTEMNTPYPHIIAIQDKRVVGYALVLLPKMRDSLKILRPMFEEIDQLYPVSSDTNQASFFVMGQVCIDKEFRGQGIFNGLYDHMRAVMTRDYDLCITEISSHNKRSLKAHSNQGFQVVHEYNSPDGHPWEIVAWDWS